MLTTLAAVTWADGTIAYLNLKAGKRSGPSFHDGYSDFNTSITARIAMSPSSPN